VKQLRGSQLRPMLCGCLLVGARLLYVTRGQSRVGELRDGRPSLPSLMDSPAGVSGGGGGRREQEQREREQAVGARRGSRIECRVLFVCL
jgi:hypothetical protein